MVNKHKLIAMLTNDGLVIHQVNSAKMIKFQFDLTDMKQLIYVGELAEKINSFVTEEGEEDEGKTSS